MSKPISIQLYTVREQMNEDPWGTLARIAEMGYPGVEPCNIPGGDPVEASKRIADLGMVVSAFQAGIPVGDRKNELLDAAAAFGTSRVVCPFYNGENFQSMDALKKTADLFREAAENCAERGMTFGYHNHDFELSIHVDGKPALLQLAALVPALHFTVDTYWVKVGGEDPVQVVRTLGEQANLLHIKDGPLLKTEAMTAAGQGKMDFPPIVEAAPHAQWLVVELDRCDTDMMEAVRQSLQYLVKSGLGSASL
ncbi:MAG: sugar phosphate isomerase/epimerase family protein [Verrucomicrobiota bacterium]